MRPSVRLVSVLAALLLVIGTISAHAAEHRQARPRMRAVTHAIVHGRDAGSSRTEATSLGSFAHRSRPAPATAEALSTARARKPMLLAGFDGLGDLDGFFPSDTMGAIGRTFIVAAVNSSIQIFDRNGTSVVPRTLLETLSEHPSILNFDPKVVFDQYKDTFLLVWLGQSDTPRSSHVFAMAIPEATATDMGTWCVWDFPGDQVPASPKLWADYPTVGYNQGRVTISTNQFTFPSNVATFRYSQVMTIDKAALYDCTGPTPIPTVFAGKKTRDTNGRQAFTLQPAQTVGSSPGAQLLVSFQPVKGRFDYVALWRIKSTATGLALKTACCLLTGKASYPPVGSQGGGTFGPDTFWDVGDLRLINAFYDADRRELFAAHTIRKNFKPDVLTGGYPEAAVRWYELNPRKKLRRSVLARKGVIGSAEIDLGWPSVATDAGGTLFVTYNRASAPHGEFLSAWIATIPPGSNKDTQLLVHAGSATYDVVAGLERWGDFTGTNRDPLSPSNVATFNQYAASSTTWQQFIAVLTQT